MIKLTSRDFAIIDFLKEFKVADTSTLQSLFFNSQATTERRLKLLTTHGYIKRNRNDILSEYYYYIKRKPTNIKHALIVSKLYAKIKSSYEIIVYKKEYELKYKNITLRADLMTVLKIEGRLVPVLYEVDLSKAYKDKYTDYINSSYYKFKFPIAPKIAVVSNRTPKSSIEIKWLKINDIY